MWTHSYYENDDSFMICENKVILKRDRLLDGTGDVVTLYFFVVLVGFKF